MTAKKKNKAQSRMRSVARLHAVQALYQVGFNKLDHADTVLQEFEDHRLGGDIEETVYHEADAEFFRDIVRGVMARRDDIEALIGRHLKKDWALDRLDPILRAVLYCGCYELTARPDVPTAVIINEYVDVTHAFFDTKQAAFINGILDAAGKEARGLPVG